MKLEAWVHMTRDIATMAISVVKYLANSINDTLQELDFPTANLTDDLELYIDRRNQGRFDNISFFSWPILLDNSIAFF